MKRLLWGAVLGASLFIIHSAFADTTSILAPNGEGYSLQWTPSTGTTHYMLVDETTCNGTTDYVRTTTVGQRDAYTVSLSSIPDGSTITAVDIKPCASRNNTGGGSATLNLFSRLNGVNSADSGAYALAASITPVELATTTITTTSTVKNASTTLQVGAIYTAGTKGIRLSKLVSRVTYTPLSAPTGLTASSSVSSTTLITLSWIDNATNEAGYKIERGLSTSSFAEIASVGTSTVSYSDGSVSPGTTYYYRVRAYNTGGNSGYSNTANTTTGSTPSAPSGLTGSQDLNLVQINLSWADNSSNETAFAIERKISTDTLYAPLATTSANATSYSDSSVTAGLVYNYRVRGYNGYGYGAYSNVATATAPFVGISPIWVLAVGGGGAGGYEGNGGGAGGVIETTAFGITIGQAYIVNIGQGGTTTDVRGATSTFSSLNAVGGGSYEVPAGNNNGGSGTGDSPLGAYNYGLGIVGQGNNGGLGANSPCYGAGGGGGAGAVGGDGSTSAGGNGGNGTSSAISASSVVYGGGGGGGTYNCGTAGTGGSGGGGNAGSPGQDGTNGLGGGGGGPMRTGASAGGKGGDGVVVLRWTTANFGTVSCTGTLTTSGSDSICTFNYADSGESITFSF